MTDIVSIPESPKTIAEARKIGDSVSVANQGNNFRIQPETLGEVLEFARLMSASKQVVPSAFRDNPGACLAIVVEAGRRGMDPFSLARQAYIAGSSGTIAYQAQAIMAMLYASPVLSGRLSYDYGGDGPSRFVIVTGRLVGETQDRTYQSPPVSAIPVKNSPLWKSDTDQQLAYYGGRAWARRHCPDVLLGIYTPDELPEDQVTPAKRSLAERAQAVREQAAAATLTQQTSAIVTEISDAPEPDFVDAIEAEAARRGVVDLFTGETE